MTQSSRTMIKSSALFWVLLLAGVVAVNVWLAGVTDCHYERTFREMYEGSRSTTSCSWGLPTPCKE